MLSGIMEISISSRTLLHFFTEHWMMRRETEPPLGDAENMTYCSDQQRGSDSKKNLHTEQDRVGKMAEEMQGTFINTEMFCWNFLASELKPENGQRMVW